MEPITLIATIVAAVFAGAATGAGEAAGTELYDVVRQKFREEGKEDLLDRIQEEPEIIRAELVEQMNDDQEYQNRLERSLDSVGLTRHVILSDLETQGGIKLEDISLKDYGSYLLNTKIISGLKANQNIEVKGLDLEFKKKLLY
jgi:hypothetical protein